MALSLNTTLPRLTERELATVTGSGLDLGINMTSSPALGTVGLTLSGRKASLAGHLQVDGYQGTASLNLHFRLGTQVDLQGYVRLKGFRPDFGLTGHVRIGNA